MPFWGPKYPNLSLIKIFGTNHHCYILLSTYWPFSFRKIQKKIVTVDPELWGCAIFGTKMVHLPPSKAFWKIIKITLIYLLAPFIVQNFKKILPADPQLWGCAIFGHKMTQFPKSGFFSENLFMSLISFIHAYLPAKNRSQIFIYYWNTDN